jgi:hypothetical protein
LQAFDIIPFRLRRFRLEHADGRARAWLRRVFAEEGRRLGTSVVDRADGSFALQW